MPASPSGKRQWPVDVAIFDDPKNVSDPEHVRIICECKCPDDQTGIAQLKVYLDREPHARVGVWFNGVDYTIVYKTKDGYEVAPDGTPIPTPQDPLGPVGRRVLNSASLRIAPSLIPVFKRIRDRLATMDQNVNRDEEILPDILLLGLMSLRVVHEQFKFLVLIQMNREDLGDRYRELLLPIPRKKVQREKLSKPICDYFAAMTLARKKFTGLTNHLDSAMFADRP